MISFHETFKMKWGEINRTKCQLFIASLIVRLQKVFLAARCSSVDEEAKAPRIPIEQTQEKAHVPQKRVKGQVTGSIYNVFCVLMFVLIWLNSYSSNNS
jgi:hypothetical protein